jgi:hypothetical protein
MSFKKYASILNDMPRKEFIKKISGISILGLATFLIPKKVWGDVWFRDDDGTMYSLDDLAGGGGGGTPAGSDGDLQINNSGVFGTIAGLNLDKTGNARGTNALDIQSKRTSATQVPSGTNNFCIGLQNTASNYNSGCVGYNNTVGGWYGFAVAVGSNNIASGYSGCTSVGSNNNNTANSGICVGASNIATYYGTTAVGRGNRATNAYSSAVGAGSWATGYGTVAFGNNVRVSGHFSNAFGNNITNTTSSCTEIGPSNSAKIRISSSGFDLTVSSLPFLPASIADSSAPNNSVYYSTTQSKLAYKDSGGTVNTLY